MPIEAVLYLLIVSGVVGRGPRAPLARHRDVATTQGAARGYFAPRPPHYAYHGLPYARPPTPRFKAPAPPPRWDGVFEASHRVKCPQPDGVGDVNCLTLNVFAPEHADSSPVLVHVHDGGFQKGWGSHQAPSRLLRLGFVVVTFNYRLGALGFLCLRTPSVPGNAGLKDQVAALYWVHRNIAKFGGNPLDVTIYGTGSGGVSVELLLLSGLAETLVHKAIIESGTVLSPSSLSYTPVDLALKEAINMGYQGNKNPKELEVFYKKTPTHKIVNSTGTFLPCIESSDSKSFFLDTDPIEVLRHGKYQHVPLMIIYTNAEEVSFVLNNLKSFNTTPESFKNMLPTNLVFGTEETKHKIANLVKEFYFDEHEVMESVVQNYIDYVNDVFIEYPIVKSSVLHAANSLQPVYLMKFKYKGGLTHLSQRIAGAGHGDIFNYLFSSEDLNGEDELVAERLATLWSNFINLGDPTPLTTSLIPVIWQPITAREVDGESGIRKVSYLEFNRVLSNERPSGQQLVFWDHIYEKFYKPHV